MLDQQPRKRRKRAGMALALLMLTSLLLRIPGLREPIWWDESLRTFEVLKGERLRQLLLHDVHNPLYNLCMAGWIRIFGDSEFSIRLPSLLAGFAATLLFWRWIRRRWGAGLAGACAAWLLLSPVMVWYSTEAKNNIFVLLWSVALLGLYTPLLGSSSAVPETRARPGVLALASALAIYTDFACLLTLLPLWALALVFARRDRDQPRRTTTCLTLLGTSALVLPLVIFKSMNLADLWRGYPWFFGGRELVLLLSDFFFSGNALAPGDPRRFDWAAAAGLASLPLLAMGGWRLTRGSQPRAAAAVVAIFMCTLAFFLVTSLVLRATHPEGVRYIYQERNVVFLVTYYALLLFAGAGALPRTWLKQFARAILILVALVASTLMISVYHAQHTVMWPTPDWRTATRLTDGAPNPLVITYSYPEPFNYYSRHTAIRVRPFRGETLQSVLQQHAQPGQQVYILSDRRWWPVPAREIEILPPNAHVRLRGLDVYTFQYPDPQANGSGR